MPLSLGAGGDLTLALILRAKNRMGGALKGARKDVRGIGDEAAKSEKKVKRLGDSFRLLRTTLVAAGVVTAVKQIADAGVAMQQVRQQLKFATGDADASFAFVADQAERLGLNLRRTAADYATLTAAARGTKLEGDAINKIFSSVAEASTVLGLSADDTTGVLRALNQMVSKGTVQAEELRGQLGERLPGAFQIAARAMKVNTMELGNMLQRGEVLSSDFLPKFAAQLKKEMGGGVEAASKTARASFNRFGNAFFELKVQLANSGLLDLLADAANGLGIVVHAMRPLIAEYHDLGNLIGASAAFIVAKFKGENDVAARIVKLRQQTRASMEAAQKTTTTATRAMSAGMRDTAEATRLTAAEIKKLGAGADQALAPALKSLDKLRKALQTQAQKNADLRATIFNATGGAARGFFSDQIRALKTQARAMLEASIKQQDVSDFVAQKLAELRGRAAKAGQQGLAREIKDLAFASQGQPLNFVRDLTAEVDKTNRSAAALRGKFGAAADAAAKAAEQLKGLKFPVGQGEQIRAQIDAIVTGLRGMAQDARFSADFDINAALGQVDVIRAELASIPREIVTVHRIVTVAEGGAAAPPAPPAGSRATGGLITAAGYYRLEGGERIVRNTQTIGDIHITAPGGLPADPAAMRALVRNVLIPELAAAAR